jgi:hypothetical protein
MPTALATLDTSAPVFSHSAEIALMEDIRWARKALATSQDNLIQARLVNRQMIRIPLSNPVGIDIHNGHPIPGTFMGNHRHGRSAYIAGANAQDVFSKMRFHVFISLHPNLAFSSIRVCAACNVSLHRPSWGAGRKAELDGVDE